MGRTKSKPLRAGTGYLMGVQPSTRMIEGHKYYYDSGPFEKKSFAKRQAAYLRKPGTLSVRVIQSHGGWVVYRYHKAGERVEKAEARRFRKKRAPHKKRK